MPMRSELPDLALRSDTRAMEMGTGSSRIVAAMSNRDLQAVAAFCAIGLLITIDAILRFPDFGQIFAQLALFP
jgi:hypothetical protein